MEEDNKALASKLHSVEEALARRVGYIEELRDHARQQSEGFEEDERRLREEIRRMDIRLDSIRNENVQLQVIEVVLKTFNICRLDKCSQRMCPEPRHRAKESSIPKGRIC